MYKGKSFDKGLASQLHVLRWAVNPQETHKATEFKVKNADAPNTNHDSERTQTST